MAEEISYAHLFDLLRKEKTREDLQVIDKKFYKNTFKILKSRQSELRVKEMQHSLVLNADVEKEKIELKNINKLLNEIIDRRQKKIILLALSRTRIPSTIINNESFSEEEAVLFEESVKLFRNFKQELSSVEFEQEKEINIPKQQVMEKEEDQKEEQIKEKKQELKTKNVKIDTKSEIIKKPIDIIKTEKKSAIEILKIKFLVAVPNFYGQQKQILGPYEKDQIVELPKVIANILIKKGRAEEIK